MLEDSPQLGATPEDRRAAVHTLRLVARIATIAGIAVAAWGVAWPHPRDLAIYALAAVPLAALALVLWQPRAYSLHDQPPAGRISLVYMHFFAIGVLALRAVLDVSLLDWQLLLGGVVLGGVLIAVLLRQLEPDLVPGWRNTPLLLLGGGFYLCGVLVPADTMFDRSNPAVYATTIQDKRIISGRGRSYLLILSEWGPKKSSGSFDVQSDFFDRVVIGDRVCAYVHPGTLRLRWYKIDFLSARRIIVAHCRLTGCCLRQPMAARLKIAHHARRAMNQHLSSFAAGPDHFARHGYAAIPNLIAPALAEFFWSYVHSKYAAGLMTWGDALVPMTPAAYGDSATEGLLEFVQPRIEHVTGRELIPTYSYLRIYKRGDRLLSHRDRPACEFSVSLNIGQQPEEPWPIFVETASGGARLDLRPGDALLYRGIDLFHWREPYAGRQLVQVFLHWVDANGPHANQKYDGRPSLMLAKTQMRT